MKKIHILVSVFISLASYSTATAASPQQSANSTQLGQVDIRKDGNTESMDTQTKPDSPIATKSDTCAKNGCPQSTSRRSRRVATQADAKSDPRRWTSTLGF